MERLSKTSKGWESHPSKDSKAFGYFFSAGQPIAFQHAVDMMQGETPSSMTI